MPEGSWKCEKCNNINYPFRTKCNRQNCGADKPAESEKSSSPAPDQNDQVCCVKYLHFVNLQCLLQRLFIFQDPCNIMNILKWQAVAKLSLKQMEKFHLYFLSFGSFYFNLRIYFFNFLCIYPLQSLICNYLLFQ